MKIISQHAKLCRVLVKMLQQCWQYFDQKRNNCENNFGQAWNDNHYWINQMSLYDIIGTLSWG